MARKKAARYTWFTVGHASKAGPASGTGCGALWVSKRWLNSFSWRRAYEQIIPSVHTPVAVARASLLEYQAASSFFGKEITARFLVRLTCSWMSDFSSAMMGAHSDSGAETARAHNSRMRSSLVPSGEDTEEGCQRVEGTAIPNSRYCPGRD